MARRGGGKATIRDPAAQKRTTTDADLRGELTTPRSDGATRTSHAYSRIDRTKRLPGFVDPTEAMSTVILSSRANGPSARPLGAPEADVCPSGMVNLPHVVPLRLTVIRIDAPVGAS